MHQVPVQQQVYSRTLKQRGHGEKSCSLFRTLIVSLHGCEHHSTAGLQISTCCFSYGTCIHGSMWTALSEALLLWGVHCVLTPHETLIQKPPTLRSHAGFNMRPVLLSFSPLFTVHLEQGPPGVLSWYRQREAHWCDSKSTMQILILLLLLSHKFPEYFPTWINGTNCLDGNESLNKIKLKDTMKWEHHLYT